MSLYKQLQQARSEEDVKDAYIKALGLKSYTKGLVDIQTKEVWFEAKDSSKHSCYAMFTQLLYYVQEAFKKGDAIPPLLAVIDTEKSAIMKTVDVLPFLQKNTIKNWGKSASAYTQEALAEVSAHIGTYFVQFRIATHEDEFISTVKEAIATGDIIRTQITPDNLKQVFDKWVSMIGKEIKGVSDEDYALLFFADIMSDGTVSTHANLPAELLHRNGDPIFSLNGSIYQLGSKEGYRQFWAIYHRPPKTEYRDYLLERRDTLIPMDERSFKGAYYTPLNVVDKAYDLLAETLGKNWQQEYVVWDMCCGVGNLEVKHSNPRNIYMSTLDQADIDVMKATKTCPSAVRFQYDYLNDDIDDFGQIDYTSTNKVPESLRKAIRDGKKILVLMNPPYAEATNRGNIMLGEKTTTKKGVSNTGISLSMQEYGKASNELFVQFMARIHKEIPNATLAMFSTLKYINAPSFEQFRRYWKAKYLGGFIVNNKVFEGLTGDFPIGFLIWDTSQKQDFGIVQVEVFNKDVNPIGEKNFYNIPSEKFLNVWIDRPRANKQEVVPLKNGISPATAKASVTTWSDGSIGYMHCAGNDVQQTEQGTTLYSSSFGNGHGFFITSENLWQSAIIFTVRRLIKQTWLNDRDQFLQPEKELLEEFKNDCLIWMLFNRCNKSASADGLEWNGREWSIVNHFIPYTEEQVNSPDRFESDFMVRYLEDKTLSIEAKAVLDAGQVLWQAYFEHTDNHMIRDELKLNRPDVGWYQIRNALKKRNESGDYATVDFKPFEKVYSDLGDKLRPQVYDLGFLRD